MGSLGALVPYWGLYLQALGFKAQAIGEFMAMIMATRMISPNIWGWLADYTGRRIIWVRWSAWLSMLCFLGIKISSSYWSLMIVMGLFSFFWHATLPLFEAVTLAYLGSQYHRYSSIRLWGSIGFIVAVVFFGWLFEQVSVLWLPWLLTGWLASIGLTSFLVQERTQVSQPVASQSFSQILRRPSVIALFIVCFFMQVSHGPYYTFYSIYLEQEGYRREVIGQLWALGVVAEIGIFLVMQHLLKHFKLRTLLIISLSLAGLRWLLIGYGVPWWMILGFAQLLHAASFGMYHGVAMQFIRHYFMDHQQGRAQALYSSLSFGAGGAVGSWVSGYTWEHQGPWFSFWLAAGLCMLAIWISWQWVEPQGHF